MNGSTDLVVIALEQSVAALDRGRMALAEAETISEVKAIVDMAAAAELYARRQQLGDEAERYARELKLDAERKLGMMLRNAPKATGAAGIGPNAVPEEYRNGQPPTLANLGIDKKVSHRAQKLAELSEEVFAEVKAGEMPLGHALNAKRKADRIADIEEQVAALSNSGLPSGVFHVIAIDPPWPYDDGDASTYDPNGRRAANPYPEMSIDEIAALDIPAADDCVLWLWTTHRFMRHAFSLLDGWGFQEKVILTWVKDRMGLGRWLRSQSEFCILAVRGSPPVNLTNQTTVLNAPMREHSRKPDEFYALVDALCVGRKLDYFSREPRDGWEQFGNDVARFAA